MARFAPMYLQKGCIIEEGADPANQPEGEIHASAVEISVLFRYLFGDKMQPYLVAGPTFAYNLSSEMTFDLTGMQFKGDLKEVTEAFDFGVTFGGGIQVDAGFGILFLEGRYSYGLMNQRKDGAVTVSTNGFEFDMDSEKEADKFTNRGLLLLAGVTFPLGQ